MKTSNFSRAGRLPGAISIARGTPPWFRGPRFEELMPSWGLVNWGKAHIRKGDRATVAIREYEQRYRQEVLERLSPSTVALVLADLCSGEAPNDPILLCWEAPGEFCHRRIAAVWLEQALGIRVPELGFEPKVGGPDGH